jgi:hypothetical protein
MPIYSQPTAKSVATISKEPSGWADRTTATLSRVDGTLTFSVTPVSGSFTIYIKGVPFTYTSAQSITWTDTEGTWYFYFDINGTLTSTQDSNAWVTALLGDGVLVASLYWDATNNISMMFSEERHGFMQGDIHLEMHNAFGTQWVSGGVLSPTTVAGTGANASDAQLGVSTVTIYDEDIRMTWSNGSPQTMNNPAAIPVYYKLGANGYWRKKTADSWPFIYSGTAGYTGAQGRIPYNQNNAGTWSLTQIAQSSYVLIHIYATNDIIEPIIAIHGQTEYATLNSAQSGITTELLSISAIVKGLNFEVTPLGSLIVQSNSGYGNTPKARFQPATAAGASYIDFRGNTFRGGTSSGVTAHSQLTGLANDDHTIYALLAGRAGGQTLIGGTAASENLTLQSTANATRGYITIPDPLTIGSNPDFSIIPISSSQVAITSRRDLQLVGNRQAGVSYTPSVIGGDGYYSVIIPSSSNSTLATVGIRATVGQTIPMLRFEDGYGTSVGTIDSSGNIALVNKNVSGVKTATFNTHQAITASTSATTIDFSSYQSATVTLVGSQATAFTLTSPAGPTACRLIVIQPASNMVTPTWTTKPYAPSGALTIATTASARTLIGLVYDGSVWYAVSSQPMTQLA